MNDIIHYGDEGKSVLAPTGAGRWFSDIGYKTSFRNNVLREFEVQSRKNLYKKRPDLWAHDVLGVTLWSKQREIAQSIVDNRNTMVAASHSAGKSYLTAVLACWWIDTRPIGQARVISTAPSTAQVQGIVWREIQLLHARSRRLHNQYLELKAQGKATGDLPDHALPGYVTSKATWRSDDGIELGSGRTPPRGREGDTYQGIHAPGGVFAIADEAVGVSKEMIDTLANNTTGPEDRRLLIANPTNPQSHMGQVWHDEEKNKVWNRITISAFDTPNFTEEWRDLPEEVYTALVSHEYVEDKRVEYGEDSANYKARVLGQWATDSGFILFPDEVLEVGKETTVIPDDPETNPNARVYFGFDVSRSEKGDYSYLYEAAEGWVWEMTEWNPETGDWDELPEPRKTDRRGVRVRFVDKWRGKPFQRLHDVNGKVQAEGANEHVHAFALAHNITELRIDANGMGLLMVDAMLDIYGGAYNIVPINSAANSPNRNAWYNMRAYMYSEFARRMRAGEIDIDPTDSALIDQLRGIEYKFAIGYAESMLIMGKEEMKRKGIRSPDAADAAMYAVTVVDASESRDGERVSVDLDEFTTAAQGNPFYSYAW